MPTIDAFITSRRVALKLQSVTHCVGWDQEYLVFPALDDGELDTAPTQNLNTDPDGPSVVVVDVHPIQEKDVRPGYHGHSGLARLSLFLLPKQFEQLVADSANLPDVPVTLDVEVDAEGDIILASLNGYQVDVVRPSDTRELAGSPASRTGTA